MSRLVQGVLLALAIHAVLPAGAAAQTIGALSWRLAPFCNTLTLTVVQDAGAIRFQGTRRPL